MPGESCRERSAAARALLASSGSVEAVVDRVSLENHRLAKRAKDLGSAAVLVCLLLVAVIWAGVLLEMP